MGKYFVGQLGLFILRILAWSYAIQPRWIRDFEGRLLGKILKLFSLRRKVIEQNLEFAYPHSIQKKHLLNAAYDHLGRLILDLLVVLGPFRWFVLKNTKVKGMENWERARAKGKGVIFLSSHVGNWELLSTSGAVRGIDALIVTKLLKPRWLHDAWEKGRKSCGVSGTYEPKTYKDVIRHLKKGGTVGIVLDQYAGPPIGVRVPFFGVPVGTSSALAVIAKRSGAPVQPVVSYRLPTGEWVSEIEKELEWKTADTHELEMAENTANYAATVERHIRTYPEQWLWSHRRFKGDLSPLRENEWSEGRLKPEDSKKTADNSALIS